MYFSKSTNGFYDPVINEHIPADAVDITAEAHAALLTGQSQGKVIVSDASGKPVLQDAPAADPKAAIRAQIEALEAQQLLPRITREFMLAAAQAQAVAAGVDPMMNVGYAKLKQFDELIASLRDKL